MANPGVTALMTRFNFADQPATDLFFQFDDGEQIPYASIAAAIADLESIDTNTLQAKRMVMLAAIRAYIASGNTDVTSFLNRTITVNMNAASPVSISASE